MQEAGGSTAGAVVGAGAVALPAGGVAGEAGGRWGGVLGGPTAGGAGALCNVLETGQPGWSHRIWQEVVALLTVSAATFGLAGLAGVGAGQASVGLQEDTGIELERCSTFSEGWLPSGQVSTQVDTYSLWSG